jgi:hypothetical protein
LAALTALTVAARQVWAQPGPVNPEPEPERAPVAPALPDGPAVAVTGPAADPEAANAEQAHEASKQRLKDTLDQLSGVPETPAAFSLGISAEAVAHPASIQEAVAELKTILGPDGELVPGAALEVAPLYRLMSAVTYQEWRDSVWRPILGSLRFSLATASDPATPAGESAPVLLAVGARLGFDGTDPRYHAAAVDAIKNALVSCAPGRIQPAGDGHATAVTGNDCDYEKQEQKIIKDLSGLRAETAGVLVYENPTAADEDTDWRRWQTWVAVDYKSSGWISLGGGVDATGEKSGDETDHRYRLGGRVALNSTAYGLSASGAYARAAEAEENWIDLGALLSAQLGTTATLKLGAQLAQNIDEDQTRLTVLLSVGTSTGTPLFDQYVDAQGKP